MNQLQFFAARALRALPTSLWWVLTALVGAVFSITLEKELFPHTPAATKVAQWLLGGCVLVLPLLGIVWLWRVAATVGHPGWRFLWYSVALGATGAGVALLLLLLVIVLLKL